MKVLFLTQIFPYPPICGGTIKSYNLLRHLASRHEVTLVSFIRKQPTAEQMQVVESICSSVKIVPIRRSAAANLKFATKSLFGRTPFIVARDNVADMQETVDNLLASGHFDLIYVDHLQMAQYVTNWNYCPKVLDEHNVEWKIIERIGKNSPFSPKGLYAGIEWKKLRRWELDTCKKFDAVFTVTEHDRETLASANGKLNNLVHLPIGVDLASFRKIELDPGAKDILSIGTMSWPPNIDAVQHFVRDIYPEIKKRVDGVRFVIAGMSPPASITKLPEKDGSIEVTGFVEDLSSVASRAAVFVVPLRSGSGMRVKILNAMAMGLPVVSTSIGCEGIGAHHNEHLLVADSDDEFADCVVRLITDFELRKRLADQGRSFIEDNFGWEAICSRMDEALKKVTGNRGQVTVGRGLPMTHDPLPLTQNPYSVQGGDLNE